MNKTEIYNSIPKEIECNFIVNAGYKITFKKEEIINILEEYNFTDLFIDDLRDLLEKIIIKKLENISEDIKQKIVLDYLDTYFEDTDEIDSINEFIAEEN